MLNTAGWPCRRNMAVLSHGLAEQTAALAVRRRACSSVQIEYALADVGMRTVGQSSIVSPLPSFYVVS